MKRKAKKRAKAKVRVVKPAQEGSFGRALRHAWDDATGQSAVIQVVSGKKASHVSIRAANGKILLSSEDYDSESNAMRAARALSKSLGLTLERKACK